MTHPSLACVIPAKKPISSHFSIEFYAFKMTTFQTNPVEDELRTFSNIHSILEVKMPNRIKAFAAIASLSISLSVSAAQCNKDSIKLQVLGSGGPELYDDRASSGYIIWHNNKARILVDTGPGTSVNFGKAGADYRDLEAIILSHLHVDHSADLPAYVKGAVFTDRIQDLMIFGPTGNELMPSTKDFIQRLFGEQGAYPYLSGFLVDYKRNYFIDVKQTDISHNKVQHFPLNKAVNISGIAVEHGPLPAAAWRVDIEGCSVVFSGDMSAKRPNLIKLAQDADMLVAHSAIPQAAEGRPATALHMIPSQIGNIAKQARVKQVVLSHRMTPSLGKEQNTLEEINKSYSGKVSFADDLDLFTLD